MAESNDPYEVLGVPRDADAGAIKKAFRGIARACHPDVAGDDPAKAERFKVARAAYELLTDPEARAAHDRATRPRPRQGRDARAERSEFFEAFYRRASTGGRPRPERSASTRTASTKTHGQRFTARKTAGGGDADDPDNLFADFGFGPGERPRARPRSSRAAGRPTARRGDDVVLELDVPEATAARGGVVEATYARLVRSPDWREGEPSPGLMPGRHAVELDVPAGTRHASVRRYGGLGDAGEYGGPPGDLVVRFRLVSGPRAPEPAPAAASSDAPAGPPLGVEPEVKTVDISVAEALLGARIEVSTPGGRVRVTVPPCSSSGQRLRLRGKGTVEGSDLYLELRIVTPDQLDAESRDLIERFARLHPEAPER